MNILLIDNNDSFTCNLEHLLATTTKGKVKVIPYNELTLELPKGYDFTVISPGPGKPSEYPQYSYLFAQNIPILGICLGMQIINKFFGGKTAPLQGCIHGKTDAIRFMGRNYQVARYHSLYLSQVADCLEVIAINASGVPMAVRHKSRKILGYQFHPESFLTQDGENFINYALKFFELN
ncbi:aminodeoxychorismate/anthranilate synthase component II [Desulfohalobiaceae bacterium Ax17]|jgi:para-aminobenzoate synthetase component 2|uniref:anthranilate synthase component II n=1 Tax=Desulfovulcanus ferrireducens TaxID=2831190 RepID=UPI00207BB45C|nr:aminodeoxychorismate/anthranilate synthase component II [Desulfovulcanus ferrireducens]MBT8762804.1 aminodeoxychorismate/anthranilate synthase component II [Desulfovulcanus ferrireducens]